MPLGKGNFFGLDIGVSAIRLVQLKGGPGHPKALVKFAHCALDPKLSMSSAIADQQLVGQAIAKLLQESGVSTTRVAVGLPSSMVFSTVVDMDRLSKQELAKTLRYQAESFIPTAASESKIDWVLLGDSPKDKNKVEVFVTSATNSFTERRLDILESIGLNVIAFEPDTLAMLRALVPPDSAQPVLVLDIGSYSTDLAISTKDAPRLVRTIPTGLAPILRVAAQRLSVTEAQAEEFVFKFGMRQDKLEGNIRNAIAGTIDALVTEVEKSLQFFVERYNGTNIGSIIITGRLSCLPELTDYLAGKFNVNVEVGNAWRNITYPPDLEAELLGAASDFAVAAGLAERHE